VEIPVDEVVDHTIDEAGMESLRKVGERLGASQ
jgi:hypothetical protein